jgi:hypothetical protein
VKAPWRAAAAISQLPREEIASAGESGARSAQRHRKKTPPAMATEIHRSKSLKTRSRDSRAVNKKKK